MSDFKNKFIANGGEAAHLDDLVKETASVMADLINENGLEEQIEFLLKHGVPEESILSVIL